MREIKFRAWDEKYGWYFFNLKDLWAEGCEQQLAELNDSKHLAASSEFPYFDFPIMQYTGIKDIHEKEAYEGDNIMCDIGFGYYPHEVKWFGSEHGNCWYPFQHLKGGKFEIIGNIYENKEN